MALKQKINKEVFDKLPVELQGEYKLVGEEYVLDISDLEDTGALKRAKERESLEKKQEKDRADKLEKELNDLKQSGARNSGDIVALEKSWKDQADAREAAAKGETKKIRGQLSKIMRDDVAMRVAMDISDSPNLILPHIAARLKAEIPDEGDPATRVLDKEGKPSALTISNLADEFRADPTFAAIIRASKASGGGASGDHKGGALKKPSEYTQTERVAFQKENPTEYAKVFPPVY